MSSTKLKSDFAERFKAALEEDERAKKSLFVVDTETPNIRDFSNFNEVGFRFSEYFKIQVERDKRIERPQLKTSYIVDNNNNIK